MEPTSKFWEFEKKMSEKKNMENLNNKFNLRLENIYYFTIKRLESL